MHTKVNANRKIRVTGKILLFDFDGTLVETETLAMQVINHYFAQKNFPGQVPFADLIVGRTWKAATEAMVEYAQVRGYDIAPPEELRREFKVLYREKFQQGVRLIPGILERLPELKAKAKFMGIVTGSERDEVLSILKTHDFGHYFDRIWAFGDYEHSKPDPSPYLTAMRDIGCNASEALVFEDSKAGMESSHRANI